MPKETKAQKETVERVMHEYKHGELQRGRGGKVTNPKQAIAIALHEAGASKYESSQKKIREFTKEPGKPAQDQIQGNAAPRPDRREPNEESQQAVGHGVALETRPRRNSTRKPSAGMCQVAQKCRRSSSRER